MSVSCRHFVPAHFSFLERKLRGRHVNYSLTSHFRSYVGSGRTNKNVFFSEKLKYNFEYSKPSKVKRVPRRAAMRNRAQRAFYARYR